MASSAQPHPIWIPFAVAAGGVAAFAVMDAVVKSLVLALGAYNAVFWRLLAAVPITGAVYLLSRPRRPSSGSVRLHLLRGMVNAACSLAFFWGLGRMPLADGIALSFVAPIIALYLAALILGERISGRVVAASLLGLVGVVVILWTQLRASTDGWDPSGAAAILVSAGLYALNIVLLRRQAQGSGPQEVAFFQALCVTGYLALFVPLFAVVPPLDQLPMILAAACLMSVAILLFAWAYRRAQAQHLASVEYSALLWGVLLGWWVFGEAVNPMTIAGALLIVGGCVLAARASRTPMSPAEAPL